jgi:hypothetical protein
MTLIKNLQSVISYIYECLGNGILLSLIMILLLSVIIYLFLSLCLLLTKKLPTSTDFYNHICYSSKL